jgi:hypothetical protein
MNPELPSFAVPDPGWIVAESNPPRAGTLVKYRTAVYQMLGYLDLNGRWIATDGQEEQLPVQSWREISDRAPRWPERAS